MSTTRIKVELPIITTRDEAEAVMNDLALAVNNQRKLIAKRDGQVLALNQQFESPLAELENDITVKTGILRAWAESTPDAFPKGRKSLDLLAGIIGFRTGMPKLMLLSRAFNWDRVLANIEAALPGFIRLKKEVDKEGLLARHGQTECKAESEAELKRLGLRVVQEETFFIEPKLTDLDSRQTSES